MIRITMYAKTPNCDLKIRIPFAFYIFLIHSFSNISILVFYTMC